MKTRLVIACFVYLLFGMVALLIFKFALGALYLIFFFVTVIGAMVLGGKRTYLLAALFLVPALIALLSTWQKLQPGFWQAGSAVITRTTDCSRSTCYTDYSYHVGARVISGVQRDEWPFSWLQNPNVFAKGDEVIVFYDPRAPDKSRLKESLTLPDWVAFASGGGLAALALLTLVTDWVTALRASQTAAPAFAQETLDVVEPPAATGDFVAAPSAPAPVPSAPPAGHGTDTIADELEKLAALRHAGEITQEEFEAAKKKLLG